MSVRPSVGVGALPQRLYEAKNAAQCKDLDEIRVRTLTHTHTHTHTADRLQYLDHAKCKLVMSNV